LAKGQEVEAYILPDNGLLRYGAFHLNLAAGLEDSLIRELNPAWNGGKKEGVDQSLHPIEPSTTVFEQTGQSSAVDVFKKKSANEFRAALFTMFQDATEDNCNHIDVNAGELHRRVGGYPSGGSQHRMPTCCSVMRSAMDDGDVIIQQPPKGKGAALTIRYAIPRKVK
jgi:5-methylcytosine-specific restriction protein A